MSSNGAGSDSLKEAQIVGGLEVVQPAPEVVHHAARTPLNYPYPPPASVPVPEGGKTICGLRKTTFWLSFVIATLVIVVVGVAVGLGVGLSSRNTQSSSAAISTNNSPSSATKTPAASSSTSSAVSSTTTTAISSVCPGKNNTIDSNSTLSLTYRILCNSDFTGSGKETLSSVVLSSFDECLGLCDSMNYFQGRSDVGCTYNFEGTGSQTPGTCWCLGGNKTTESDTGNVIAVPQ